MDEKAKELVEKNKLTEEGVKSLSESSIKVVYRIFFGPDKQTVKELSDE